VRAAYSSGKPAYGVGAGQCTGAAGQGRPTWKRRWAKIVQGKSFDFGTVCSSEQAVVAEHGLRERIMAALKARKAFVCDAKQTEALAKLLLTPHFTVNPDCVGQAPTRIAQMAGFEVPADTSILVVEIKGRRQEASSLG